MSKAVTCKVFEPFFARSFKGFRELVIVFRECYESNKLQDFLRTVLGCFTSKAGPSRSPWSPRLSPAGFSRNCYGFFRSAKVPLKCLFRACLWFFESNVFPEQLTFMVE